MANNNLDLLLLQVLGLSSLLLARGNTGFPLCSDQTLPVLLDAAAGLEFCSNRGIGDLSCCDAADDAALEAQFEAMGIKPEDSACAGLIKSIICQKCNPFTAELFNTGSTTRTVPLLCSSHSDNSSHNKEDYCEQVWKHCKNTELSNSPFQPSAEVYAGLTGPSFVRTDFWSTENEFCAAYAGTSNNHSACFNGHGSFQQLLKGCALRRLVMDPTLAWLLTLTALAGPSSPLKMGRYCCLPFLN